ncbi:uncharacterized protein PgNI_04953 [Pyricularia grisea]|uniref:Uncharacterized protein n=1 Tax=Pyricularia grisea TaxID=148305 RepID=A0A6P8B934_PYRGI|nr:uncharacterized protein PgNI_04953 [Pyricularia grisea]TLD12339.1 hypothetical protein PgNI_04953 [Pyricularia grisea]
MTDACNDACSSGAVRSTASLVSVRFVQGVPEADKAECKVELAQNYHIKNKKKKKESVSHLPSTTSFLPSSDHKKIPTQDR